MTYYSGFVPNPTIAPPSNASFPVTANPIPTLGLIYDGTSDNLSIINAALTAHGYAYIPSGPGDIAISGPIILGQGQGLIMDTSVTPVFANSEANTAIVPTAGFSATLTSAQQALFPGLFATPWSGTMPSLICFGGDMGYLKGVYASNEPASNSLHALVFAAQNCLVTDCGFGSLVDGTAVLDSAMQASALSQPFTITTTLTAGVSSGTTLTVNAPGIPTQANNGDHIVVPDSAGHYMSFVANGVSVAGATTITITAQTVVAGWVTGASYTSLNANANHGQHTINTVTIRAKNGGVNSVGLDTETFDWLIMNLRSTQGSNIFNCGGAQVVGGHFTGAGSGFGYNSLVSNNVSFTSCYFDSGAATDLIRHNDTGTFNSTFVNCRYVNNSASAMNLFNEQSTTCGVTVIGAQFGSSSHKFNSIITGANIFDQVGDIAFPTTAFTTNTVAGWFPTAMPGRVGTIQNGSSITNPNIQLFTASGTFSIPLAASVLKISAIGSGGQGGGGGSATGVTLQVGGGGGGAGAAIQDIVSVGAATTLTVTIGAGGSAAGGGGALGGNPGVNGSNGANTTVIGTGISVIANGGSGGPLSAANSTTVVGGGGYGSDGPQNQSNPGVPGTGGGSGKRGGDPLAACGGGGGGGGPASATNGGGGGGAGGGQNGGSLGGNGTSGSSAGANGTAAAANTGAGGGGGGGGAAGTGAGGNGGAGGSGWALIEVIG